VIEWPQSLVHDLARRRALLFLGAGVSMNSVSEIDPARHPPSWAQFLQTALAKCPNPIRHVTTLINNGDYLTACEIIKDKLQNDWNAVVHDQFVAPRFLPAPIHGDIFKLDSRIVLTQNVDKVYDTFALNESKNTVYLKEYSQEDVAHVVRGDRRCILKAHGTVDTPGQMIFTRQDYAAARYKYARFYVLLDALAITHTFMFVGCGLSDPDVQLMLERYTQVFPGTRPHYMVAPRGSLHRDVQESVQRNLNLKLLLYKPDNNHQELRDSLAALVGLVDEERNNLSATRDW
jgi:hypothetical protein